MVVGTLSRCTGNRERGTDCIGSGIERAQGGLKVCRGGNVEER